MDFSKRIKELREKKGLSQEALSDALKIPRSSVTHYENSDDRIPRQKRLNEIADFFGVTVDYLIGRADTNELTTAEESLLADIDGLELEEIMNKHNIRIDGRKATKEEIAFAISTIRSLRNMK
jgi:transcriptional regulator with XRE-family HTH domain